MGFFKNLLEKKECDLCGGEIGLLGNRKLEDGNMCGKCAKKLSPWFSDRKNSTVAEIQQQLEYRQKNAQDLTNFRITRQIGEYNAMYVEEINGVPTRFFISRGSNPMESNPDIIQFKDVVSCVVDIDSFKKEDKTTNSEGKSVSYDPPRYQYDYTLRINMTIKDNPYFDKIGFQVISGDITVIREEGFGSNGFNNSFGSNNFGGGFGNSFGNGFGNNILGGILGGLNAPTTTHGNYASILSGNAQMDNLSQRKYVEAVTICEQICQIVDIAKQTSSNIGGGYGQQQPILEGRMAPPQQSTTQEIQQETPHVAAPKFCPNCGTETQGAKFCPSCGSKLC